MNKKYLLTCKICLKKYVNVSISNTCSSECHEKFTNLIKEKLALKELEFKKKFCKRKKKKKKKKKKEKVKLLNEIIQKKNKQIRELKFVLKNKKIKIEKNDFYDTNEWKTLRYLALKKYGRKCMLCGTTDGAMHVDHIKPRSKYPELELDFNNLQILCANCNLGKSNVFEDDFRFLQK